MNSRWRYDALYSESRSQRESDPPHKFAAQDRSHLAGRISLDEYSFALATAMRGMGRISATDRLQVGKGVKQTAIQGVRALGTQAAHRGSGSTGVLVSKALDSSRFTRLQSLLPRDWPIKNGYLLAPLHLFAASKTGAAMLLDSEQAVTLLPTWANRLNSYMERNGERHARTDMLRSASQFRFTEPATIAAFTLQRTYCRLIPGLVKIATNMIAYYADKAKATGQNGDKAMVGRAEEYRDFLAIIARQHEIPPCDPSRAVVPAATFITVESAVRAFEKVEGAPAEDDRVEGWTEKRIGSVNFIVPR